MYKIYKMETGETLDDVAKKFRTDVETLEKINGFSSMQGPTPNQYIIVPEQRDVLFDLYIVQPGDNMYRIAKRYNVSEDNLLKLNGINKNDYIYPNQELLVPRKEVAVYITKEGDTLMGAASALDLSAEDLILENETIYLIPDQLLISKKEKKN